MPSSGLNYGAENGKRNETETFISIQGESGAVFGQVIADINIATSKVLLFQMTSRLTLLISDTVSQNIILIQSVHAS
jgi:hypothetical protein